MNRYDTCHRFLSICDCAENFIVKEMKSHKIKGNAILILFKQGIKKFWCNENTKWSLLMGALVSICYNVKWDPEQKHGMFLLKSRGESRIIMLFLFKWKELRIGVNMIIIED